MDRGSSSWHDQFAWSNESWGTVVTINNPIVVRLKEATNFWGGGDFVQEKRRETANGEHALRPNVLGQNVCQLIIVVVEALAYR